MVGTDSARVLGGIGVLACVICCVSIPSVVAVISALGLGFLRNDRLLFPAEVVSVAILLVTFARSRLHHGRNAPLLAGTAAAALMFYGLKTPAPVGTMAALAGAGAVVAIVVWDWRLQKRCTV
jgi:MerC mercury resistance protein.